MDDRQLLEDAASGVASRLLSGFSGSAAALGLAYRIASEMQQAQSAWVHRLRLRGVKAAHPDDGWVDRARNSIRFAYPQFNDGAGVGDLVALGWPSSPVRIVRLTAADCGGWLFETEPEHA